MKAILRQAHKVVLSEEITSIEGNGITQDAITNGEQILNPLEVLLFKKFLYYIFKFGFQLSGSQWIMMQAVQDYEKQKLNEKITNL